MGGQLTGKSWVLSIMPKIPEISVGIQMVRSVSVSSDRNIRDHLWRWSTFETNRFFALIGEFGRVCRIIIMPA